ncbi:MAG TPA: aminoacyl--tRNA ligase-related protein [Candidatus Saccharimonadales bacterium]|nr:aminoacyl--tRNA ligase-related protein [Candidatus Saccharimonadales bacterium]
MKMTQLFTKTSKTVPADETSKNAKLLIQAGYIHKEMAGVYDYLPLGLRVLENIKQIVREEMNAVGGRELIMSNLQRPELWMETTRWDDKVVDIWFKTKLQDQTEIGLAWSHEEPIMDMMQHFVQSYKDLPAVVYQFQTKLRNELRAKSGIMRGREFVMKDMYSLHVSAEDLDTYYNKVIEAYKRVYERLGIGKDTYVTFASGGAFTKFSHEFQTICDAGEDILYLHREKNIAVNEEVLDEAVKELGVNKDEMEKIKSAEVGNVFNFGTDKSNAMKIYFTGKNGEQLPIYLASYGIGVTRVMGVIVEKFADDKGIVWPEAIAPFKIYLARLGDEADVVKAADDAYKRLTDAGIEVLYDERDARPGEKFADADLLGIPYRLVLSAKTLAEGKCELKRRTETDTVLLTIDEVTKKIAVGKGTLV